MTIRIEKRAADILAQANQIDQLSMEIDVAGKAKHSNGIGGELELNLPAIKKGYAMNSVGLLVPESEIQLLNPEDLREVPIGERGRILLRSLPDSLSDISAFGERLDEMTQTIAETEGREYKSRAVYDGVYETAYNAVKHGMNWSGKPISIEWNLGAEKSGFIITDSGEKEFDPLKYAKMPLEEYYDQPDFEQKGGHAGVIRVVGKLVPGEDDVEPPIKPGDIEWIALRDGEGNRVGTKTVFKVQSRPKTESE